MHMVPKYEIDSNKPFAKNPLERVWPSHIETTKSYERRRNLGTYKLNSVVPRERRVPP